MNNLDKHFCITSHSQVAQLVKPLVQTLELNSFAYQKSFPNGDSVRLSNYPQWLKHFYSEKLYQKSIFEHRSQQGPQGYIVWKQMHHHDRVLNAARAFNIGHGMTFSFPHSDYHEYYFFGLANHQERMMPYWLRNIDLFHHFINFFHDHGKQLLNQANKHPVQIHHHQTDAVAPQQEPAWSSFDNPIDREQFFSITPINQFRIDQQTHLSKRELTCARLLLQGNRTKEIANKLFISPRTVERHLTNLKNKLHCSNQSQLFKKLVQLGIK